MFFRSDNLAPRIVWTMLVEIVVLIITIVLAMVETSSWPTPFFYLTIGCVVVLNMANGIYQNTVFGLAARLPVKYTGAVVLGSVSFLSEKSCENLFNNGVMRLFLDYDDTLTQDQVPSEVKMRKFLNWSTVGPKET